MRRSAAAAWAALPLLLPLPARADGPVPDLPRLAGILVAGGVRQAIFAGRGQHWASALGEGETIGAFTVGAIGPDGVELTTPTSRYLVLPSSDSSIRLERLAIPVDPTADK